MHTRSALAIIVILGLFSSHSFSAQEVNEITEETQSPSSIALFNDAVRTSREASLKGDWKKAIKHSEVSLKLADEVLAEKPKQMATLSYNHGVLLYKRAKYKESAAILKIALKQYEELYGKEAIELQPLVSQLAMSLGHAQDRGNNRFFRRALALTEAHYGKNSAEYGKLTIDRGVVLSHYFSYRKGKKTLEQGRDLMLSLEGESSPQAGWASFNLGKLALGRKKWDDSSEHLLKALDSFEIPDEPSNRIELSAHAFLVRAYSEQDEEELATRHCLAIGRMTPQHPDQDYQPIYKKQPRYPSSALRSGTSGWSIVEFDVDKQGFVRNPRIVEKSNAAFDRTSKAAVLNFRYAPAFKDGQAVVTKNVQNKIAYHIAR